MLRTIWRQAYDIVNNLFSFQDYLISAIFYIHGRLWFKRKKEEKKRRDGHIIL